MKQFCERAILCLFLNLAVWTSDFFDIERGREVGGRGGVFCENLFFLWCVGINFGYAQAINSKGKLIFLQEF